RIYGPDHVAGQPLGGTVDTVAQITLDGLKAWYAKSVSPKHATLHVAGAIDQSQVLAAMQRLDAEWQGGEIAFPPLEAPAPPTSPTVYFVDVPGSKQSVIYVGKAALRGD